jgi:hypothetical protein
MSHAGAQQSAKPYPITPAVIQQRRNAAMRHGLFSDRDRPDLARRLRRRVSERINHLRKRHPTLADLPRAALLRFAECDLVLGAVADELLHGGVVNETGEARRLLGQYRLLLDSWRAFADQLGILSQAAPPPAWPFQRRDQ